ncbi:MAG: hypothetical protein ACTSU5_08470 [Promethearchaeota archaeon]
MKLDLHPTWQGCLKFALAFAVLGLVGLLLMRFELVPAQVYWTMVLVWFGLVILAVVMLIVWAQNA